MPPQENQNSNSPIYSQQPAGGYTRPPEIKKNNKLIIILIIIIIILLGMMSSLLYKQSGDKEDKNEGDKMEAKALTEESLKNLTLEKGLFGIDDTIAFKDGSFEVPASSSVVGSSSTRVTIGDFKFGDVDGDGYEDAMAIVAIDFGGSGNFKHLVVFKNENNKPVYSGEADLGDRTVIDEIVLEKGIITLNTKVAGEKDGLCCPSVPKVTQYKLEDKKLEIVSEKKYVTYTNEEYGIKFSYPDHYTELPQNEIPTEDVYPVGRVKALLVLNADGQKDLDKIVVEKPIFYSSNDQIGPILTNNSVLGESAKIPDLDSFKKITINGKEFYYILSERFEGTLVHNYFYVGGGKVYPFSVVAQGVAWTDPNLDTENELRHSELRQILSTFEVIYTEEKVSGWKDYKNSEYGFEFQYPPAWSITRIGCSKQVCFVDGNGESVMSVTYSTEKSNSGAFKDLYEKFDYFHGETLDDYWNNGYRTVVSLAGCYECYGYSKDQLEKASNQTLSFTCNESGEACVTIYLTPSSQREWFLKEFMPKLKFDSKIFDSIRYQESKG